MSFIAKTCLHLTPLAKLVKKLWPQDNCQSRIPRDMIPQWLNEILAGGYPDYDILTTIEETLEDKNLVLCDIPKNGTTSDEQIVCRPNIRV